MQKLLRKNILRPALSSVRGGHGWDAPHPPVPSAYDHKRIVSLFHIFVEICVSLSCFIGNV